MSEEFLFVEKYRPKKIEDCILPEKVLANFKSMILSGTIPSMIFHGSSGVGKTTAALAIAEELGFDKMVINGSSENGIDILRTKITQFASSISTNGKPKMLIVDEADGLSAIFQGAAKNFMEEYSENLVFIYTCNHPKKLIPAIHSRCAAIDFRILNADKPKIAAKFSKRLCSILDKEGITYSTEVVAKFLIKFFPDFRRTINELQRYSNNEERTIDVGILGVTDTENIRELVSLLKDKDFKRARAWVSQNSDMDSPLFFRTLYESLLDKVNEVPQLVILLADYSYKSAFCSDQEINNTATLVEIMGNMSFK